MPGGFIPPEQIKQIGWSRQGRRNPKRRTGKIKSFLSFFLVEARGVEPLSENASTGTSPGADGYLHSLTQAWAVTLRGLVASLFMVRSKLCAHTCTTKRRPIPARGPSGLDGCVKPQRELRYRCSLIYKVAHFKDVRRIRPLFPPLRPRRNQYAPVSPEQSPYRSLSPKSESSFNPPLPQFLLCCTRNCGKSGAGGWFISAGIAEIVSSNWQGGMPRQREIKDLGLLRLGVVHAEGLHGDGLHPLLL